MSAEELANIKRVHWVGQSVVVEYKDGRSITYRQKASHPYKFLDLWQFEDKGKTQYYYALRATDKGKKKDGICTLAKCFKIEGDPNFL